MYNPSAELQKAIIQKLKPFGLKVYDTVPMDATMPYYVIGEDVLIDNSIKGLRGTEHIFTIHGWSKGTDSSIIKTLQAQAMDALINGNYTLNGAVLMRCQLDLSQVLKDPSSTQSSSVYHLVLQVRYLVIENA